ncbi:hypothetical protein GE09DRAFT_971867 [Coniochaeta sp. 2T2.1]|nr:hypothetical protein GE09DRAFT_971867 [Coniochaeta sp. 2T2.1]
MLLKHSKIALCSCSCLHATPLPSVLSSTSSCRPPVRRRRTLHESTSASQVPRRGLQSETCRRSFATIRDSHDSRAARDTPPLPWPTHKEPTPYDIFHISKGAVYNKVRFYELVKLYHPDRKHHTQHDGLPHLTKLERYRLVVAANDILRDPEKRRLYDVYGAGWGGTGDMKNNVREMDRAWRSAPGNASMNATWEDWERWYDERDGKKQQPVFMANGGFAVLVLLFVTVAGWGQATRAGKHSVNLLEMREQKHETVSKGLQHTVAEAAGKSREDRVQRFLRQRDSWAHDSPSGQGR